MNFFKIWLFRHGLKKPGAILSVNPLLLRLTEDIRKPSIPDLIDVHKIWMIENEIVYRFETIRRMPKSDINNIEHFPTSFKRGWKDDDDFAVAFLRKQDAAKFMMLFTAKVIKC